MWKDIVMKDNLVFWVKKILFVLLKIFYICPVKKNRIVFFSYYGRQYSCNPKYLTEYLVSHHLGDFDLWWQFLQPEKFEELREKGIRLTRYDSLRGMVNLMTSKVVVTNVDYPIYIPFRKNQFLINTWHGGGAYKKVGTDIRSLAPSRMKTEEKSKKVVNLYISSSKMFTEKVIRGAFRFSGEVLECGMPRNDILLGDTQDLYRKVRQYYHLSPAQKIVLYAPTFREDRTIQNYGLDFEGLRTALVKRFGGEWVCFFRAHSNLIRQFQNLTFDKTIINASEYNEMQELLCAADVLITDYSSSMWDFSLMKKPCFLYAVDKAAYQQERDFYLPMERWPFPYADNNETLQSNIALFDERAYVQAVDRHHEELGSTESGEASRIVVDRMLKECLEG